MKDLVERIKKYEERREKRLRGEGRKETIRSMIRNMLKSNESEETIMKYTNAKKEEIEKIKKELEVQLN